MKEVLKICAAAYMLLYSSASFSQVNMPALFGDNMVLQRNTPAAVWGTDVPDTHITVTGSWDESADTKADGQGRWKVKLNTPGAGGPHTVTIAGTDTVVMHNVMIGEVWVCSGQSNMEMPVKGYFNQPVHGSQEAILHSANNHIRLFTVERNPSLVPVEDVGGEWLVATPRTVKDFSAVGYFFGRKINEMLDVPVGLISTVWGASTVEAWMDQETCSGLKEIEILQEIPEKYPQQSPALLYNGMLYPIIGYGIKGFTWYQGESNITEADAYLEMFPAMVEQWREQWKMGILPFYYVQIAPFKYWGNNPVYLREAQLKTMQKLAHSGMVVTVDVGDCEFIHSPEKKIVGERLAYWALAKDYGFEGIAFSGPVYKKFEISGEGAISLYFDYCPNGLTSFGEPLAGFEISGEDRNFYPATAVIENDGTVSVWSEMVANPVAVRYAFTHCPVGTLFNIEGLPASPFRTDNWEGSD